MCNILDINVIKSIVAFDLEATSLPQYDGFKTKVTEISFVACSVEHLNELKSPQTIPRVVHKLSICSNPHKMIVESASRATGLYNEMLQSESYFTNKTGNLIKSFLEHLQQPVCLIAHNGDKFDFPILAKVLKDNNVTLPENVFCVDSLRAFREIDSINEEKLIIEHEYEISEMVAVQEIFHSFIDNTEECSINNIKSDCDNKDENKNFQQINETTPRRLTDNSTPKRKTKNVCRESQATSFKSAKRQLFSESILSPSTERQTDPNQFKKGYKLAQLYNRFCKREPVVKHQAEADAIHLLECIAATKKDFIPFMNKDAVLFSKIKPLGTIIHQ